MYVHSGISQKSYSCTYSIRLRYEECPAIIMHNCISCTVAMSEEEDDRRIVSDRIHYTLKTHSRAPTFT